MEKFARPTVEMLRSMTDMEKFIRPTEEMRRTIADMEKFTRPEEVREKTDEPSRNSPPLTQNENTEDKTNDED